MDVFWKRYKENVKLLLYKKWIELLVQNEDPGM